MKRECTAARQFEGLQQEQNNQMRDFQILHNMNSKITDRRANKKSGFKSSILLHFERTADLNGFILELLRRIKEEADMNMNALYGLKAYAAAYMESAIAELDTEKNEIFLYKKSNRPVQTVKIIVSLKSDMEYFWFSRCVEKVTRDLCKTMKARVRELDFR